MEKEPDKSGFIFWLPLVISIFAALGFAMDASMISVATAKITGDLGSTIELIVLALSVYSAVIAGLTIVAGKTADLFGKRKMLMIGLSIFIIGSIFSALSVNGIMFLFSWSILKTIGGVFILPVTASLLIVSYEGKDRATAFGIFSAIAGIAAVIGALVMGGLSDMISWRLAFVVTSFFTVISIGLLLRIKEQPKSGFSIDWTGTILLLISFFTIVFGLGQIDYWYLMIVGFGSLGIFVYWAFKLEKEGRSPIFRLSLLRNSQFTWSSLANTLLVLGGQGFGLTFPVILGVLGNFSAIELAIMQVPYYLGVFFGAVGSGPLGRKVEPKLVVILGFLLGVAGFTTVFWIFGSISSFMQIVPVLLIAGAGFGLVLPWLQNIALSALNPQESGEGAGVFKTMSILGASIGIAVIGVAVAYLHYIIVGVFVIGLLLSFALPKLRKKKELHE